MWSIKNTKDKSVLYNFVVGVEYIVGRKGSEILLVDESVSRKHASLEVNHIKENLIDENSPSVLTLKELSSRYGSFCNGLQLQNNQEIKLKVGDIVKFGVFESEFIVCYSPLVITTSCLQSSKKEELCQILLKLGGHIVPEWRPSCSHLVMSDVKVTVKTLCCLLALKPLVLPEYFVELHDCIVNKDSLPETKAYIPPVGEPSIDKEKVSFDIMPQRKKLFENKNIIFLEERQMNKLHLAITSAQGNCMLLRRTQSVDKKILCKNNSCVVQPMGDMKDPSFVAFVKEISAILQRQKKRLIPESEFGLAVSYCSTERFCNSDFEAGSALFLSSSIKSQTFSHQEVYVPGTDDDAFEERRAKMRKICFPEKSTSSGSFNIGASTSGQISTASKSPMPKRKTTNRSSEEESTLTPMKRIKTEERIEEVQHESRSNQISTSQTTNRSEHSFPEMNIELSPNRTLPVLENANAENNEVETTVSETNRLTNGTIGTSRSVTDQSEMNTSDNLPRNLIKIQLVSLIKPQSQNLPSVSHGNEKNFKKFKKVVHVGFRAAVSIIRENDMKAYSGITLPKGVDLWMQENEVPAETQGESQEELGEFDWESQSNSRRRRR